MKSLVRTISLSVMVALAVPVLTSTQGCSSSVDDAIELAELGQDCLVNSDCTSPNVCVFQACHSECQASRDCEAGARCIAAADPYKVCQLEAERLCRNGADCGEGLVCGVDGECRDKCERDGDCVDEQRCVSGTCADEDELDDSGMLQPANGSVGGVEGSPCVYVSDCSGALLCRGQACLPQCKTDAECGLGQVCQDTRCVDAGEPVVACSFNSQCTKPGELCLGGGCHCECAEKRDCASGQRCGKCGCEPDPDAPQACVYNSDCDDPEKICRDRQCDCECKGDADCREGTKCNDCACVGVDAPIDHTVLGSVNIASSFQLASYAGVTHIEGDLIIGDAALSDLGDTFASLQRVGGAIMVTSCNHLTKLSFGALVEAGSIFLTDLPSLTDLDLHAVSSPYVALAKLPNIDTLVLGGLQTTSLSLDTMRDLTTLEVPNVTELDSLRVIGAPHLETLDLPKLSSIRSSLQIGMPKPGSSGSPSGMNPVQPPAPSALLAPKLETIGSKVNPAIIEIDRTNLTTLASFGKPGWIGVISAAASLIDNAQLTEEESSTFLAHLQLCPWGTTDPECSE
jgi:hypothetical protein